MQESILSKLEASRKELLDLGMRNPLLHYKQPKSKGLHIVQESAAHVYDLLVKEGKAMSFTGRPATDEGKEESPFEAPDEEQRSQLYSDTKLQTTETETTLQHKLLNTYYAARTSIEEQGVNILYISLGMLQWYEAEASEEPRLAPLVLVPVSLERSSAKERFRIKFSEEEVGHNLSLQEKLRLEFGIAIPGLPEEEEGFSIQRYFDEVAGLVGRQKRWKVIPDGIELGFFSFGKFMLFHDLDNAEWPDGKKPVEHPLLQSLFGHGFEDPPPTAGDDAFIDTETSANELYQVLDADSSQLLAMLAVQEGRNMVIQGPPGTGKSQTITNLIADAIGRGKKVLFVAEKAAALEVVKRRLDNIGLGEACLELHSHKANKKELHQELKRVLELGKPSVHRLREEVALLSKHKEELNAYCAAVNAPIGYSALTAHHIYGLLLKLNEEGGETLLPKIYLPDVENWNDQRQKEAEAMAIRIQARLKDLGVPSQGKFWGTGLRVLLPQEGEALKTTLQLAQASIEKLAVTAAEIAAAMGFAPVKKREEAMRLALWVQTAAAGPDLHDLAVQNKAWLLQKADVEELLATGRQLKDLKERYASIFLPEAWEQDMLPVRQSLKEHGRKWYRLLIGDYTKAIKGVKSVLQSALPDDLDTRIQYVEDVLTVQRLQKVLVEYEAFAKELFGARWQGEKTAWATLQPAASYLHDVHQQVAEEKSPKALLDYLSRQEAPSVAQRYYDALLASLNEGGKAVQAVMDALQFNESRRFRGGSFQSQSFTAQLSLLASWKESIADVHLAIGWNNLVDVAKEEALDSLTDASVEWPEAASHLLRALQKTWYEYLLQQAITRHLPLRKFERTGHEEVIKGFRRLDLLNLHYNRALAALKHWEELPNTEGSGQVRILKGEFNKKARHLPIRKLMQDAGHAVQAIKPVFMMSPLSIANFLAPGAMDFDLVIFDEASQVRPVEALGALLRGGQLVVVGDTKQLPPTSFFDTINDNVEEEENVTADMESILGMCDAQGAQQSMLRWHYRSRHESLIALSNHEFYEDKLIIFPSPGSREQTGLFFHHLPAAVYDRGGRRTNQQEAEAVAEAVMDHARKSPKLSLGVVAFSNAQREAIQYAVETKRRATPDLEGFFKTSAEEPFFIKNLENVQGDERDVIFISIGYGKTAEGQVSMNFGPLNNEGGEKRLNVLITRAKTRCEVFTNITAADIDAGRTAARGVLALKRFLHFAQHGSLDVPLVTGKPFDSPFEEVVAAQLSRAGYTVKQQVGSKGFYLDLAIVDPLHPGRYLLGIECDGAAYHSARSARDRDRLRQQVLEGIGWRIHRIWSTDWFRSPERELKRTIEAIEKAAQASLIADDATAGVLIESSITREAVPDETVTVPEYEAATLPAEIGSKELHLHTVGKLASWIESVVQRESPVHVEEVARRVVEAAGITRLGSRIRGQLELATKFAEGGGKIKRKGDFLWSPQMEAPVIRNRSKLPAASKKIKFIAPEELQLAVEKVVKESIAIQPEGAVIAVCKLFGFVRVTEDMREDVLEAIQLLLANQKMEKEGEVLKMR